MKKLFIFFTLYFVSNLYACDAPETKDAKKQLQEEIQEIRNACLQEAFFGTNSNSEYCSSITLYTKLLKEKGYFRKVEQYKELNGEYDLLHLMCL